MNRVCWKSEALNEVAKRKTIEQTVENQKETIIMLNEDTDRLLDKTKLLRSIIRKKDDRISNLLIEKNRWQREALDKRSQIKHNKEDIKQLEQTKLVLREQLDKLADKIEDQHAIIRYLESGLHPKTQVITICVATVLAGIRKKAKNVKRLTANIIMNIWSKYKQWKTEKKSAL
jgi:chromosome segregation ATPase